MPEIGLKIFGAFKKHAPGVQIGASEPLRNPYDLHPGEMSRKPSYSQSTSCLSGIPNNLVNSPWLHVSLKEEFKLVRGIETSLRDAEILLDFGSFNRTLTGLMYSKHNQNKNWRISNYQVSI